MNGRDLCVLLINFELFSYTYLSKVSLACLSDPEPKIYSTEEIINEMIQGVPEVSTPKNSKFEMMTNLAQKRLAIIHYHEKLGYTFECINISRRHDSWVDTEETEVYMRTPVKPNGES